MSNITAAIGTLSNSRVHEIPAGTTVAQAFRIAGVEVPANFEILVDGIKITDPNNTTVLDGQLVLASDKPKGNE